MNETGPSRDCPLCPRLKQFRDEARALAPNWFNAPVPSFGDEHARLLVVGLAPGLRGANRTGRPFTGDYAGDLLYATLIDTGFATGAYDKRPDDGLRLVDCLVSNAVRCVPPQNKPTPAEIRTCRPFLEGLIASMSELKAIVALGRIAHDSLLKALSVKAAGARFGHGRQHELQTNDRRLVLMDSYHCSRYNTNTGVLTHAMFHDVFAKLRDLLAVS